MYRTIVADPPWLERGGGKIKRGADRHYPLMTTTDIIETMRVALRDHRVATTMDQHLYLWVTNNFLADGLETMTALGFRYVTNLVWVKQRIGLGQYFRGQHELCLFGVRGKGFAVKTDDRTIRSVIEADRGRHSAKPDAFYELVERRSIGPYLELFARETRLGWTPWGNEVETTSDTDTACQQATLTEQEDA